MESFDQSETANHARLLTLLQNISLGVDAADMAEQAFQVALTELCRFMNWPLGHVFLWSEAEGKLVSSRIWYVTDPAAMLPFRELSERTTYAPGEGTVGRVMVTGEPFSVLDVTQEPIFVRRLPVEDGVIRSYFAFPIHVQGEVAAVIEFFSPDAVAPNQDVLSIIGHVGTLLGLALQRQRAFQQLQRSESQLEEAQRTARVGHWEWDTVQDEVFWSDELYRVFGLEPGDLEASQDGVNRYVHPADLDYVLQKTAEMFEQGIPADYFLRIIRPDGKVRVLHSRGRPIYDDAGNVVRLHGTAQDMTEQKETELKLAETVRQLSAMMDIGQAIAASLDLEVIYDQVMSRVRPLLGAEAFILLIEKEGELEIVAMDHESVADMRGVRMPPGPSIVGKAWSSGQSLWVRGDAARRINSAALTQLTGYQPLAALAVPVRWRNELVGVLSAIHRDEDAFTEEDLDLLEMVAAWTAIALGNARQYEQLQRRLTESNAIVAISSAFTKTLDLAELLQLIADKTHEVVDHADWAAIHLLDPLTNTLELVASAGLDLGSEAYAVARGEGVAGHVLTAGEVLNVSDVQADPRRLPIDVRLGTRSLLVAPIESREGQIGTISIQSDQPGSFVDEDEQLLTVLGVQAGLAIENARLYAAQQRARDRAERQRERMQDMARRVVMAQEEERARIARELHDESGQSLTSLKISLGMLRAQLPEELEAAREMLGDLVDLTDRTMSNLRLLSHGLRPPGLDAYGLDAALEGLCEDFRLHTRLDISYRGDESLTVDPLPALSVYRFAQEALTNIAKHAYATAVEVTLRQEANRIKLSVQDNGQGFNPPNPDQDQPRNGTGLLGMIERLEMVDGLLEIDSAPGRGSRLTAVVPMIIEGEA
jgi:PAS domain S-box-containing protein